MMFLVAKFALMYDPCSMFYMNEQQYIFNDGLTCC